MFEILASLLTVHVCLACKIHDGSFCVNTLPNHALTLCIYRGYHWSERKYWTIGTLSVWIPCDFIWLSHVHTKMWIYYALFVNIQPNYLLLCIYRGEGWSAGQYVHEVLKILAVWWLSHMDVNSAHRNLNLWFSSLWLYSAKLPCYLIYRGYDLTWVELMDNKSTQRVQTSSKCSSDITPIEP